MTTSPINVEAVFAGDAELNASAFEAVLAVGYMAIFADGREEDAELDVLRRAALTLQPSSVSTLDATLDRLASEYESKGFDTWLGLVVPRLAHPEARATAYKLAHVVALGDLSDDDGESEFEEKLRVALKLSVEDVEAIEDSVAEVLSLDNLA